MNSKQSYCLRSRHFSQTLNENVYENVKPKTKKQVKIIKGTFSICGRNKSQIFNK